MQLKKDDFIILKNYSPLEWDSDSGHHCGDGNTDLPDYQYAVLIDMLCQIIACQDTEWSSEELKYVRKFANARVAKSKGVIDLKTLLDDHWGKEYEDNEQ